MKSHLYQIGFYVQVRSTCFLLQQEIFITISRQIYIAG